MKTFHAFLFAAFLISLYCIADPTSAGPLLTSSRSFKESKRRLVNSRISIGHASASNSTNCSVTSSWIEPNSS